MKNRDFEFSDELLSGYLDDELPSSERELVEKAVSESEDLKETIESISKLKKSLSELPSFELDDRFAKRVSDSLRQTSPVVRKPSISRQKIKNLKKETDLMTLLKLKEVVNKDFNFLISAPS